jgi:SAM-dependent methyltransferase
VPSVEWVRSTLVPPMHVFVNGETPPLPFPDAHFDLIWAVSVFTHLRDHWADWLVELHRLLTPDGRLVATFLGEGMSESIANEPWDPDRVGMNVLRAWQPWDLGGPSVQHSEWWLREHWGRVFTVECVDDGPSSDTGWLS